MSIIVVAAWFFVFATILWVATHTKIKRVQYNISSDDCPKEIKEAYFRKHPGAKWIFYLEASFDRVNKHMKDFASYLKDTEELKEHKISSLAAIEIITVLTMGQELLESAYRKLVRISPRKADRIIKKYGTNTATEKYFGGLIEDFYYTTFVLDEMKERLERKENINISSEVLTSCKERAHNIRIKYAAQDQITYKKHFCI